MPIPFRILQAKLRVAMIVDPNDARRNPRRTAKSNKQGTPCLAVALGILQCRRRGLVVTFHVVDVRQAVVDAEDAAKTSKEFRIILNSELPVL